MSTKDRAIVARWTPRLAARRALLVAARRRHVAHPTASTRKTLDLRKRQVASAERVLRRHTGVTSMSSKGVAFVAAFEGGQSPDGLFRAYLDPVGVPTIGYGETKGVHLGMKPWTKAKALRELRRRLNADYLAPVLDLYADLGLDIEQHEADALGSASYNLGSGIFSAGKTMGDAVRSGVRSRIADAFLVYVKAGGRVLPGLVRRRKAERALFLGQ